jgi:hypothetical protein
VNLAQKLRTLRMAQTQDGESFAVLISNPTLPTQIQLDLRLIEADQVATPDLPWKPPPKKTPGNPASPTHPLQPVTFAFRPGCAS